MEERRMKGDYVDEKNLSNYKMFAKSLHQTHKFHQPPQTSPFHHHLHFQVAARDDFPEEAKGACSPYDHTTTASAKNKAQPTTGNDGATIEVVRRPRGRPPGSKNKPKPPFILTLENESAMSPCILELPGGVDMVESITRFCRKRGIGLCVLSGSGTVANVTLRQPSTTPGPSVTFHGRFDILSISATVLPSSMGSVAATANVFTISLAGPHGQVVGGSVDGALLAGGTVYVIAASFNSTLYHLLTVDNEVTPASGGGSESHHSPSVASGGGGDSMHLPTAVGTVDSSGISVYNCHLPADVIWGPIARQPPPY